MAEQDPLFSPSLIPSSLQSSLSGGLVCRPLQRSDFRHGHLAVLGDLAHVGNVTEKEWIERFDDMKNCNSTYFIVVFVHPGREDEKVIVGTGTLIVEKKL